MRPTGRARRLAVCGHSGRGLPGRREGRERRRRVAGSDEEWREKLEKLILNGDLRRQMGEIAREKVLENYTNKNSRNKEYYDHLKSKLE